MEWRCPYCDRDQMVSDETRHANWASLPVGKSVHGFLAIQYLAIRCANPKCNEVMIRTWLKQAQVNRADEWFLTANEIQQWLLRPDSLAKPQPDYIPAPLREDYAEACLIRDREP